jgi:hypothetical protein
MFSIIVNDQKLDSAGIKVNLYLKSTFPFTPDQGQIEGSFAFNGKLPNSPLNKRIFGFPHRLEGVFDLPVNIPCKLTINARVWYDALISITSATEISLQFDLLIGYGSFASLINGKSLKNLTFPDLIDMGDDQEEVIAFANVIAGQSYPATFFNFPMIYAPDFYGDNNPTFLDFVNLYVADSFQQNVININGTQNLNTLVPMLYLQYVARLCFESFGYKPSGTFFDDPDLAKAMLYNNYAIDQKYKKFLVQAYQGAAQEFPPMPTKIMFTDDSTFPNVDDYDIFDTTASEYTISSVGEYMIPLSFKFYNLLDDPMKLKVSLYADADLIETVTFNETEWWKWQPREVLFTKYFDIDSIGKKLSISIDLEDQYGGTTCNAYIKTASVVFENVSLTDLNEFTRQLDLRNHVPDKEVSAFLINLQLIFGIIIGFDHELKLADVSFVRDALLCTEANDLTEFTRLSSKKVTIVPPDGYNIRFEFDSSDEETKMISETVDLSNLIGEFATFSDLPFPSQLSDLAYVLNTNCYYIFSRPDGLASSWNLLCHYHPMIMTGNGLNEVGPDMSPLLMHRHPGTRSILPVIRQQGTSLAFSDEINETELRFFFFHGLQMQTDFDSYYPFASSLSYDPRGNSIGNIDLTFTGNKGLYKLFLENYYYWLTDLMKQAVFRTRMTFSLLKTLDLQNIYKIFNSRFLIKEAKIAVSDDEMADVEIECWKV